MTQDSLKIADASERDLNPVRVDFGRQVYCLFGIPVDALSFQEAVAELQQAVARGDRCVWSTPNLNHLTSCLKSPEFRDILGKSQLSTVDGMPLLILSRMLGIPVPERVPGSTVFDKMMSGAAGPMKVYFFGGPEGAAARASERLPELSPSLRSAGSFSPGYGPIESMSRKDILENINRSGADLLILALNAKRGHSWISLNSPHLNVPVIAHLGSVINFVAGTIRRSPEFLQKTGMEWLWRIWEEPYLASRYARDFVDLAKLLATKAFPLLLFGPALKLAGSGARSLEVAVTAQDGSAVIELKGSASALHLEGLRKTLDQYQEFPGELVVCLREVSYVDAALLGLLIVARGGRLEKGLPVWIRSPRRSGVRFLVHLHCANYLIGPRDN
ncbi:WecB/TagA/CpsF family glycosyltransferase [Bradyrhizobium sp. LTSP857]|uniref:WecB/TagA/CpsF family glycosyltransferase n=1 Tax=Bradyrhizobium sp. LTSP857 TaxID=1619231 RepID=UPI000678998B|nr:WecB/TagA/CpsF family glycosyltransferase [Bradyrhizobium sp. LTSP857]